MVTFLQVLMMHRVNDIYSFLVMQLDMDAKIVLYSTRNISRSLGHSSHQKLHARFTDIILMTRIESSTKRQTISFTALQFHERRALSHIYILTAKVISNEPFLHVRHLTTGKGWDFFSSLREKEIGFLQLTTRERDGISSTHLHVANLKLEGMRKIVDRVVAERKGFCFASLP